MRSPRYLNVPTFWGSGETRSVRLTVRLFLWSFIDIWTYPRFERPVRLFRWGSLWYYSVSLAQISERTHVLSVRWDFSSEIHWDITRWVSHRYLNVPTFWASGETFPVGATVILLGESQCVESRWDFFVSVFQGFPCDSFVVNLGESFSIFHCECFVNLSLWVHVEFDRSGFC